MMKEKKEAVLNVTVTPSQKEFIQKQAEKQDISVSQYFRQVLKREMEKNK